jgi:hypothetical protein
MRFKGDVSPGDIVAAVAAEAVDPDRLLLLLATMLIGLIR